MPADIADRGQDGKELIILLHRKSCRLTGSLRRLTNTLLNLLLGQDVL